MHSPARPLPTSPYGAALLLLRTRPARRPCPGLVTRRFRHAARWRCCYRVAAYLLATVFLLLCLGLYLHRQPQPRPPVARPVGLEEFERADATGFEWSDSTIP